MAKHTLLGKIISLLTDCVSGLAAFGILTVVLIQVVSRLFLIPVSWTEEATRYLFIWMIFLGIAAGFRAVEVARVTAFFNVLPALLRRLSVWIYAVSSMLFFALATWTGASLVRQQYMMNETTATLAMPMWLIGTIMPVSAVLAIACIVDSLRARYTLIAQPNESLAPETADSVRAARHEEQP